MIAEVERDDIPSLPLIPMFLEKLQIDPLGTEEDGRDGLLRKNPVSFAEEQCFKERFLARKEFILGDTGGLHYAAAILDPHVHGRGLTPVQLLEGCEFLTSQMQIGLNDLAEYRTKSGTFSSSFLWNSSSVGTAEDRLIEEIIPKRENLSPLSWWEAYFISTDIGKAASRLLRVVPTSASVERVNSQQLFQHNKERNRLKHERVRPLTSA